jgi:hypothetical protein
VPRGQALDALGKRIIHLTDALTDAGEVGISRHRLPAAR